MPAQRHVFEEVADEIALWLDDMSKDVATALLDHGRGPFTVKPKAAEMIAFYDRQFFLPDGSPNVEGRTREMDRLGVAQFAQAMRTIVRVREQGLQSVLSELSPTGAEEEATPAVEGVDRQQGPPGGY